MPKPKNTICLWFNKDAQDAARFYADTFPDSKVTAVHHAPGDFPGGKKGDVLTVEFTVVGLPCLGRVLGACRMLHRCTSLQQGQVWLGHANDCSRRVSVF